MFVSVVVGVPTLAGSLSVECVKVAVFLRAQVAVGRRTAVCMPVLVVL